MNYPSLDGHPRISIKQDTMVGKPCIRGTRITVELLLNYLAAGDTIEEILVDYPGVMRDDISAALAYAASAMHPVRAKEAAE